MSASHIKDELPILSKEKKIKIVEEHKCFGWFIISKLGDGIGDEKLIMYGPPINYTHNFLFLCSL